MSSQGTITPKSIISKLLQARTTPTIFLPMSWTSPLTVAKRIFPALDVSPCFLSFSIYGSKNETAFFITLADLTTWGKNIFPSPNRSPTLVIPFINGPSIILRALGYLLIASFKSSSIYSVIPLTNE